MAKANYLPMRKPNDGLWELARVFPANTRLLEIGSYAGESAEIFLKAGRVSLIVCVDPWKNGYDDHDAASKRCPMADVEAEFDRRMSQFDKSQWRKLKMTAGEAFELLRREVVAGADNGFDAVYIDGCHQYEQVRQDIENAYRILPPDSLLCGHDFGSHCPGVQKAVLEFSGPDGPDRVFSDLSWLIRTK
jgi:predicted O-methyltransferase YrrM